MGSIAIGVRIGNARWRRTRRRPWGWALSKSHSLRSKICCSASAGGIALFQQRYCCSTSSSGSLPDPLQERQRVEAVGRDVLGADAAKGLLAEPGDADHEELIEIRTENREELHALESGFEDLGALPARVR